MDETDPVDDLWAILESHLSGAKRKGLGWDLNCPMCVMRGETPDRKARLHVERANFNTIWFNCFNCRFKGKFVRGDHWNANLGKFLAQIGVPSREISLLRLRCDLLVNTSTTADTIQPQVATVELPEGSRSLQDWDASNCTDPDYLDTVSYLLTRGETIARAMTYYWTTHAKFRRRLLVPAWDDQRLVGWIGRAIDPTVKAKYFSQLPKNLLFNAQILNHPHRKYAFLVEGVFDAVAIEGIGALRNALNEQQCRAINNSGKQAVVVPDRDAAGLGLVETAIKQQWGVAIPNYAGRAWWHREVKDVAEAVARYGRLYVMRSIVESISFDETEIRLRAHYLKDNHE